MVLEFLSEELPWRNLKSKNEDDIVKKKSECLEDPEHLLWRTATAKMVQVKNIFYSINKLQYADKPDYEYIRGQLQELLSQYDTTESNVDSIFATQVIFSVTGRRGRRGRGRGKGRKR